MITIIIKVLIVLFSYLFGAFPTAFVLYKIKTGKDIRKEGSGNVGGTNVTRTIGAGFGIITIIVDIIKGFLPVLIVYFSYPRDLVLLVLASAAAVIGHDYPVYLKFKGGKGISSSFGVIVGLCSFPFVLNLPVWLRLLPIFIILFTWLIVFAISRIVSLSSLCAAIATPLAFYFSGYPLLIVIISICLFILTFIGHRDNIKRLIKKEEKKLTAKKEK